MKKHLQEEKFDTKHITRLTFYDPENPNRKWSKGPKALERSLDFLLNYNMGDQVILRLPQPDEEWENNPNTRGLPYQIIRDGIYRVTKKFPDLLQCDTNNKCEGVLVKTYELIYDRKE